MCVCVSASAAILAQTLLAQGGTLPEVILREFRSHRRLATYSSIHRTRPHPPAPALKTKLKSLLAEVDKLEAQVDALNIEMAALEEERSRICGIVAMDPESDSEDSQDPDRQYTQDSEQTGEQDGDKPGTRHWPGAHQRQKARPRGWASLTNLNAEQLDEILLRTK